MTAHPNPPVPEACEPIHYTAREFLACRRELRDILIAPFDESKCKGIGYNISPSELCYSVKKKHLLQIHRTEQEIDAFHILPLKLRFPTGDFIEWNIQSCLKFAVDQRR